MLWNPKPGQKVLIRYRKSLRRMAIWHDIIGCVICAATGPKCLNVLVELYNSLGHPVHRVVVPRGNLFLEKG